MRNSQSPSIQSIYQNALPFYLDRADIYSVDETEQVFANKFLQDLLGGQVSLQVDASSLAADKLRHLYFEARNFEKTAGPKTFGFGYPLLIDSFEGELLVAPIFIWHLSIEPAQTKVDAWVLRFSDQNPILPNYQVLAYLKRKYDLDLTDRVVGLALQRNLTKKTLQDFCRELKNRLHLGEVSLENGIAPSPGIDEIGQLTNPGNLHWSGILSLFPPQDVHWSPGGQKPEDVFAPGAGATTAESFVFPYLPADPEQVTALESIASHTMSVVEGIDTLGKTQTVLNLLINALSSGQKCLVVSERAPALKKTQDLLVRAGFDQLHFLLDDAQNDKMLMLELLRLAAGGSGRAITFNTQDFQNKKSHFLKSKESLDKAYSAVRKPVFGENNWTETVGLFLASNRIEGKELLAIHLNQQDFSFQKKEYDALRSGVLICYPSFQKIKTLNHPLGSLHDDNFIDGDEQDRHRAVEDRLQQFLGKSKLLQHRYISESAGYAANLKEHYLDYHGKLESLLAKLNDKVTVYLEMYNNDYRKAGSGAFRLPLFFSSKKKKVAKAQQDTAKEYRLLLKTHASHNYFEHEALPSKDGLHVERMIADLDRFSDALKKWRARIESIVQDEVLRLNSKTAHPALDVKEKVTQLEYSLDLLLEELNESRLFQKPFENKTLTVPQRQKYLESIIDQLETTQLNLRDFGIYFQWQNNWLKLGPLGQKVVRALVKVKPGNWLAAFESWYFHSLLSLRKNEDLPDSESIVQEYADAWHSLRPLIPQQIAHHWQQRQVESSKKLKKTDKKKYQLIFERSGQQIAQSMPLDQILSGGVEAVTDLLPILFVSPHVALNVLPQDFKFDLVVMEEANRFSVETATSIVKLGNRVAIFGSDDNNGNETSLLQYAIESGLPTVNITNTYEAPFLQSAAQHGLRTFHFENEFRIESLEGRFHELEGTNDVEAQHIIRLLNQIKQTPQRVYPSVGIVALTLDQRDLIASYLLKLKQQNAVGSEKIRHIERNGMGVYYVEEIFGMHFDILVLSTTYGMVDLKGTLTKKMVYLNTPEGVSHMKTLINKPVQQLYLIHSFQDSHLKKFRSKTHDEGTYLLANLIQLCEAKNNGNEPLLLESMEAVGKIRKRQATESIFVNEVMASLEPYFGKERFTSNEIHEDVILPVLVQPKVEEQTPAVIHPEGFFAGTDSTSGLWEAQHRFSLEKAGLKYLPIWSIEWLKDQQNAARKVASQLIKWDGPNQSNDSTIEEGGEINVVEDGKEE